LVEGNFIGTDISGTKPLGNSFDGVLVEDASTNTVGGTTAGSGNVISGNGSNGVNVLAVNAPATGNTIAGNLIGVSSGGATPLGNAGAGINLSGALNSIIGGATDSARNAISANGQWGIVLHDKAAGTLIQGNYIGTDTSGMAGLGNTFQGIFVENAPNNIIGGMSVGAGNVVSANHMEGIRFLDTDAHGNTVQGNFIGTKAGGIGALGNDSHGISIKAADSNAIGGSVAGSGNTIAYNGGDGVFLESGVGNAILHNSIEANAGLGIDLFPVGVTLNDAGDADPGANLLQNYPVLTGLSASGGSTTLHGRLSSTPNTTFVVELFVNVIGDPSGYGEGRTYLDSKAVTTGSDGNVSFADSFVTTFPANAVFTATATDPANNTSEFSPCFPLYGDVNSDGIVDNVDVVEILRAAGGLGTVVIFQNGDVAPAPSNDLRGFGDGRLDARDALRILRHIHGLEIQWP
jgi:hypothetical protein